MRKQRAFATLTEAELEQVGTWLRSEKYEHVRERVNKPRPDGFGLNISIKPLQRLHERVAFLDLVNSRLPDDKKLTLAQFISLASPTLDLERLTASTTDALSRSTSQTTANVHQAILDSAHLLVTHDQNTPAQLLSLQHLADLPARVEIRQQRLQLDRAKQQHKRDMDVFRKEIATARLELARQNFDFRQTRHEHRLRASDNEKPVFPLKE